MTSDVLAAPARRAAPSAATETEAYSVPGIPVLIFGIVIFLAATGLTIYGVVARNIASLGAVLFIASDFCWHGLMTVAPGEARVLQLFGSYRGTVREPGLRWVNPFTRPRRRVSVRIRNLETPVAKVNDAEGNPIEIAAVVVWQVQDTAKAIYAVDEYAKFVATQTETAVRHIASSYPYDSRGTDALSLRENADEITERLSAEVSARVQRAGVEVIESRLTRLSYATEIAQAMLRQQQANAVVGARQRIVEGAVGMVQLALQRLKDEGVIDLDEERKAVMVSNLLVVLCSERATQQVVNTGSLYQ